MRRILGSVITGLFTGALVLSVAWATSGLLPKATRSVVEEKAHGHSHADTPAVDHAVVAQAATTASAERLPGGLFKVGTSEVSVAPIRFPEGPWLAHDPDDEANDPSDGAVNCTTFVEDAEAQIYSDLTAEPGCINTFDGRWATGVDEVHDLGLKARAMAISNGETSIAFVELDMVSWFYGFDPKLCPDDSQPLPQDTCGSRAIAQSMAEEFQSTYPGLGFSPASFVIAASHTHASPDTAKGAPAWYFQYVRDQIKASLRAAVEDMVANPLAQIQIGSIAAKPFNVDRRLVTRAIPDYELTWLRAVTVPGTETQPTAAAPAAQETPGGHGNGKGGRPTPTPTPTPSPSPTEEPEPETIATLVNYSVHTTVTAGNHQMHSGFVGHLDRKLEELWGGNTVFIAGGLGDQTVVRGFGRDGHGYGLAEMVVRSAQQSGYTLKTNNIQMHQRVVTVPADNLSLVVANKAGAFVRDATVPGPHAAGHTHSHQQKDGANTPMCVASSPISARVPVGGFVLGTPGTGVPRDGASNEGSGNIHPYEVWAGDAIAIMQAPGEIFSSISAVTKDYLSRTRTTMVLGMANDHAGYIIPSQQYDIRAANAAGIAAPSHSMTDYEESLSTGRCTGDQIQNHLIEVGKVLGVLGVGEDGASASREVTAEDQVPAP